MRLLPFLMLAACTRDTVPDSPDAGPIDYPPPRTDLVPAIGSEATLEIVTWNLENFPATSSTAATVADVIASLDVDVVVTQEIASEDAWTELAARLGDTHGSILSTHVYNPADYQKLGVLYRRSLVAAGEPTLLFQADGYAFPRPPLSVTITVDGTTIELVGVHLKAGPEFEDADRRRDAIATLDTHFRAQIDGGGEAEIVLLGDYNETVTDTPGREVLAPILTATDRYTLRTEPAAIAGESTYLGFGGSFIDHITTTAALDARWSAATTQVVDLRPAIFGYRNAVSDHLPVALIAPR
jgi:endonuclease/exonuclease/phosphatase family metal-dependent hydrolase